MDSTSATNNLQFIGVSGLYKSGSSAVVSLLKEYSSTNVIEREFRPLDYGLLTYIEKTLEGQNDIQELHRLKKCALQYGKNKNFFFEFYNNTIKVYNLVIHQIKKKFPEFKTSLIFTKHEQYRAYNTQFPTYTLAVHKFFSILETLKEKSTTEQEAIHDIVILAVKDYFQTILSSRDNGKLLILNQTLKQMSPSLSELIPFAKNIVVMRDPRDQFCDIVNRPHASPAFRKPGRVDYFISTYKNRYIETDKYTELHPEFLLKICYEDLMYRYEQTRKAIEDFTHLEDRSGKPKTLMNPDTGLQYIRLFEKHEKTEEIRCIEDKLSEWLYDFPEKTIVKSMEK